MNAVRHAQLARALCEAVEGGFEKAATLCRVQKSFLQACCDPASGKYLAIDVVDDLERAVGRRIYTDALRREPGTQIDLEDLIEEAAEMTVASANSLDLARRCARDRKLSAAEKRAVRRDAARIRDQVEDYLAAAEAVTA